MDSAKRSGGRRLLSCRRADKEKICLNWLDEFATYHETMPDTDFIQLPYANKRVVYNFFQEDRFPLPTDEKISSSFFYKIWRKKRYRIKLRKYLRFSKCNTCVRLRPSKENSSDKDKSEQNKKELTWHLEFIKGERNYLYTKRDLALELSVLKKFNYNVYIYVYNV